MGVRIPPGLPFFYSSLRNDLYMFEKVVQFLKEVQIELKKVVWPTRKDTIASTSVVLVLVMIIAIFLGLVDFGLSRIIRAILG
jgi:preprotein translocase subunit SecE